MPLYELGLIVDPEATPEEEQGLLDRIETLVTEAGGQIVNKDAWGRRQLAYPIDKKNYGVYHFWKLEVGGDILSTLEFELRTHDLAMRHLVLNLDRELRRERKRKRTEQVKARRKAQKREAVVDDDDASAGASAEV
jgi:small subunit ribosomal protein S6